MKVNLRYEVIAMLLSAVVIGGCSKEENDEYTVLSNSFSGVVLYADTKEPFTSDLIEIIGSNPYEHDAYRKTFQIEPDELFNKRVESSGIWLFQIDLVPDDAVILYKHGNEVGISQYCTLMESVKDHSGNAVLAYIPDSVQFNYIDVHDATPYGDRAHRGELLREPLTKEAVKEVRLYDRSSTTIRILFLTGGLGLVGIFIAAEMVLKDRNHFSIW